MWLELDDKDTSNTKREGFLVFAEIFQTEISMPFEDLYILLVGVLKISFLFNINAVGIGL